MPEITYYNQRRGTYSVKASVAIVRVLKVLKMGIL